MSKGKINSSLPLRGKPLNTNGKDLTLDDICRNKNTVVHHTMPNALSVLGTGKRINNLTLVTLGCALNGGKVGNKNLPKPPKNLVTEHTIIRNTDNK